MNTKRIPKLNTALVGFIDILGFKQKVLAVGNDAELLSLHGEVKRVHDIFDKDPTNPTTKEARKITAKRILALSDALVVSVNFKSKFAELSGILDTLSQELSDLALCQGLCVLEGIFLRGGIAMGYHYENPKGDMLLSSAMVKAYETERDACFPVLALEESFHRFFTSHSGNRAYMAEVAPNNTLFMTVKHATTGKIIHCLDYFNITRHECVGWHCSGDLHAYKAERDEAKKQEILNASYLQSELRFVNAHKTAIQNELAKSREPCVRLKFEWLKQYHNESISKCNFPDEYKVS